MFRSSISRIPFPFPRWCQHVINHPADYVILDTETTDLRGPIVELSIISSNGSLLYNSLIKPGARISRDAMKVHRITEAMVDRAPTLADEWPRILEAVGDRRIVTYNAKFDRERIEQSLMLDGINQPDACTWNYQCAMAGYAQFWNAPPRPGTRFRNAPWQQLEEACKQQGIALPPGLHRALNDAQATLALIQKIAADGPAAKTYRISQQKMLWS